MTEIEAEADSEVEHPLTGGATRAGVVRVGDTVRRPTHERSAFVQRVLIRLGEADVPGVPRHLGIDAAGREILTFLPGETGHGRSDWTDEQLAALAVIVRRMHDALADIAGPAETICHGDVSPWNVALTGGVPTGLYDFDNAAPGRRVDDIAHLAWAFLGLGRPEVGAAVQAARVRRLCEAYDGGASLPLPPGGSVRAGFVDAVLGQQDEILPFRQGLAQTASDPEVRAFNAQRAIDVARDRAWMVRHRDLFEA